MAKQITTLLLGYLLLLVTNASLAQISLSNYETYTLEVVPYRTDYGNTLTEKDVNLNFSRLIKVKENGDLYIRVNFLNGLESNYLHQTAIAGIGFAYRVSYTMPVYRVSIIDDTGNLLLQKIYGGEKRKTLFGETDRIPSVEDLRYEWNNKREEFYKNLESVASEESEQPMDEDLKMAVLKKNQEINNPVEEIAETDDNTETVAPPEEETAPQNNQNNRTRAEDDGSRPKVNIYRRPDKRADAEKDLSEPTLNEDAAQFADLNGLVSVDACTKYSYRLTNKHDLASLTVMIKEAIDRDPVEIYLEPGTSKFFSGLPHREGWMTVLYDQYLYQDQIIGLNSELNLLGVEEQRPYKLTSIVDAFFEKAQPRLVFAPQLDPETDEVIDYQLESSEWEEMLSNYLDTLPDVSLRGADHQKIIELTSQKLRLKAIRNVSRRIEQNMDDEFHQKLLMPLIRNSENYRSVTPLFSLSFEQSLLSLGSGINEYWNKSSNSRASLSIRLPLEMQFGQRANGIFSGLYLRLGYESTLIDFNQEDYQAFAIDPETITDQPEEVLDVEQFAIQATGISAGLAWKMYFPMPIVEVEAGGMFGGSTRLLWGEDQGQFPRNIFSPENEIITDPVSLSGFRPYAGLKVGVPFYISSKKNEACVSGLRNVHLFAAIRAFPVDFSKNDNYNMFLQDDNGAFTPIPLEDNASKWLIHLSLGGAIEF